MPNITIKKAVNLGPSAPTVGNVTYSLNGGAGTNTGVAALNAARGEYAATMTVDSATSYTVLWQYSGGEPSAVDEINPVTADVGATAPAGWLNAAAFADDITFADLAVNSVGQVQFDPAQPLEAPRNVTAVADTSLTVNDALHCAVAVEAGKKAVIGSNYVLKTPAGTTLATRLLDSPTNPTSLS